MDFLLLFFLFGNSITSSDRNWTKMTKWKKSVSFCLFLLSFFWYASIFALISSILMYIFIVDSPLASLVRQSLLSWWYCCNDEVWWLWYGVWLILRINKRNSQNLCKPVLQGTRYIRINTMTEYLITVINFGLNSGLILHLRPRSPFALPSNWIICYFILAKHQTVSSPMLNGSKKRIQDHRRSNNYVFINAKVSLPDVMSGWVFNIGYERFFAQWSIESQWKPKIKKNKE